MASWEWDSRSSMPPHADLVASICYYIMSSVLFVNILFRHACYMLVVSSLLVFLLCALDLEEHGSYRRQIRGRSPWQREAGEHRAARTPCVIPFCDFVAHWHIADTPSHLLGNSRMPRALADLPQGVTAAYRRLPRSVALIYSSLVSSLFIYIFRSS